MVERCREALSAHGMDVKPNSALGSLFRRAGRLNSEWIAGSENEDIALLMEADEAYRIAEAVLTAIGDHSAREAMRRVTKSDMRLSYRQPSQGKDALFELSLVESLRGRGVPARFRDPPDVEIDLPDGLGTYGVACKKVYSLKSVEGQLSKGLKQVAPYDGLGIVAFNLDDLVQERSILVAADRAQASETLARINMQFIERHRRRFQDAVMAGRCDGIWVSVSAHADVKAMTPRFNRLTENAIWTVEGAKALSKTRLQALQTAIER
ncbi:MAG: hypothetical protein JSR59_04115 [Proteobacteria bacterium]|nr:hypothetical protein [Pseudomonadota bacterium]